MKHKQIKCKCGKIMRPELGGAIFLSDNAKVRYVCLCGQTKEIVVASVNRIST